MYVSLSVTFLVLQSSRLHFIGTWKNRYRKRFPILSTEFNNDNSNISASDISRNSVIIHVDMVRCTYKDVGKNYCCQLLFIFRFWIVMSFNCMLPQDCFFVSVVIRNHPELLDQPVAVCHSNNSNGTAEISSANYPARNHGWLYAKLYMIIRVYASASYIVCLFWYVTYAFIC